MFLLIIGKIRYKKKKKSAKLQLTSSEQSVFRVALKTTNSRRGIKDEKIEEEYTHQDN